MSDSASRNAPDAAVVDLPLLKRALQSASPWELLFLATPLGLPAALGFLMYALLRTQGKIESDDAKNVIEIIKAGAESRVRKMTIKVERQNTAGLDLTLEKVNAKRP